MVHKLFEPTITGFPGDEDNGSMSSWYLFSVMGFYPLNPASGEYVISGPVADEILIHLEEQDLIINKQDINLDNIKNRVNYFDLIKGGHLSQIIKK